jgi:CheY-like chemotaxis protein
MEPVTVLVIEDGAEAALVCAALAKQPDVRVLDAPDVRKALKRIEGQSSRVVVAIVGADALAKSGELVKKLEARGIPIVGVATGLPPAARQRALADGVKEIHDRPVKWQPYSELIGSLVSRFTHPN